MKIEVSCFKTADNATPFCGADVNKILDMIKKGKWKDRVDQFKASKNVEERRNLKKTALPAFTPSGTFQYRRGDKLIRHSGLIAIDLDNLYDMDLKALKDKLAQDPFIYSIFTSVSGRGLAVIARIEDEPAKHFSAFKALEQYYLEKYGLKVDSQCNDICRLRYVSYDPDVYFNPNAEVFKNYIEKSNGKKHENNQASVEDAEKMIGQIEYVVSQVEKKGVVLGDDSYNEWLRVGFAIASELAENGRKYFHRISSVSNKYNSVDCDRQYDQCIREYKSEKGITIGTLFYYAKKAGLDVPLRKLRRYNKQGKSIFEPLLEVEIFKDDKHLIFIDQRIYMYERGCYREFDDRHYLRLIEKQIKDYLNGRRAIAKEILETLKDNLFKEDQQVNVTPKLINVKNGILNIDNYELIPHSPEHIFTYQINANYNPNAGCEGFEEFLKEILVVEDTLKPDYELIRLIQQFVGYCLL